MRTGVWPILMTIGAALILGLPQDTAEAEESRSLKGETVPRLVTLRVETPEGDWLSIAVREGQEAVVEFLDTGRRFGLRPHVGSRSEEVEVQVLDLGPRGLATRSEGQVIETIRARAGFAAHPSVSSLFSVEVEEIGPMPRHSSSSASTGDGPRLGARARPNLDEPEIGELCCVTCNQISACGCFVRASCGSCCDCCSPPDL